MEVVLLLHGLKVHLMAVAVGYTDTTCKASGEGSSSNISSFVCVCVCVCVDAVKFDLGQIMCTANWYLYPILMTRKVWTRCTNNSTMKLYEDAPMNYNFPHFMTVNKITA